MIDQALDDMDLRVHETVEKSAVDLMETVDVGHNKSFMKNVRRRAMQALFRSLMDDDNRREAFEAAVIQVATSNKLIGSIASAVVVNDRVIAVDVKLVAARVHKELSSLSQESALMVLPSPPPFHANASSSDSEAEKSWSCKSPSYKKKAKKNTFSGSDNGTCSSSVSEKKTFFCRRKFRRELCRSHVRKDLSG